MFLSDSSKQGFHRLLWIALGLALAVGVSCKQQDSSFASAQKITSRQQLIGGPHALGEVGDYLLENDEIRLVIHDKSFNRGNGLHGGSLIDADLRRPGSEGNIHGGNGKDSFGEFFPAWFLEVIDPQVIEIVKDGSGGGEAIIEVRGKGGEFVTMLRFINQIFTNAYEPDLESILAGRPATSSGMPRAKFKVRYILEPDSRHVRVKATMFNNSFQVLEFPNRRVTSALQQFVDFDFQSLEIPTGHAIGFGAHNRLFLPGIGYDIRFGLEKVYEEGVELPVLPGLPTDFLATTGKGDVNYGFIAARDEESNLIHTLNQKMDEAYGPGTDANDSLVLFDAAGFTGVLTDRLPEKMAPAVCRKADTAREACRWRHRDCSDNNCSEKVASCIDKYVNNCTDQNEDLPTRFTFSNHFIVGDGNVTSIQSEIYDIRDRDVTSISGRVFDQSTGKPVGPNANLLISRARDDGNHCDVSGGLSPEPYSQIHSNKDGYVEFELPPGDYCYRIRKAGRQLTSYTHFEVGSESDYLRFYANPTAHLKATVTNAGGIPMPAKLVVVGTHEAHPDTTPRKFLFDLEAGEPWRTTDMIPDQSSDPSTRRYIERVIPTDSTGYANAKVRPGDYEVYIHRGPEYELQTRSIELDPNGTAHIQASLAHVVDTEGYLSGDFHLHAAGSIDSGVQYHARVSSLAANDLEVPVATDHNYHSDYLPYIYRRGYNEWLKSLIGVELTTFEFGHFNAFPLKYEIGKQNHGSIPWQRRPPTEIFNSLREQGAYGEENTIVQVNHPRDSILGYFSQFYLDGLTAEAALSTKGQSGIDEVIAAVSSPSGDAYVKEVEQEDGGTELQSTWSRNFDAVSILTGKRKDLIKHYRIPYEAEVGTKEGWPEAKMQAILQKDCEAEQQENLTEYLDQECQKQHPDKTRQECPLTADDVERSEWCSLTKEDIFERYPEGAILCDEGSVAYPGTLDDWYNLLNNRAEDGTYYRYTATGNSDTHSHAAPQQYDPGMTRNYFYVGRDNPEAMKPLELVDAIQNNRSFVTTGPFVTMNVDNTRIGGQTVSDDGTVEVDVTVRAADWVGANRLKLIGNGRPVEVDNDATPTIHEFELENGSYSTTFDVDLEGDSWFVIEVRGDKNLFPIFPPLEKPPMNFSAIMAQVAGPLGFGGGEDVLGPDMTYPMTPFAVTNPVWVVDSRETDSGEPIFTPEDPNMPSCDQPSVTLGTYSDPNWADSTDSDGGGS